MATISEVLDSLNNLSALVDAETAQIVAKLEEIKTNSTAAGAAELDKVIAQIRAISDKVKAEIPDEAPATEPTPVVEPAIEPAPPTEPPAEVASEPTTDPTLT